MADLSELLEIEEDEDGPIDLDKAEERELDDGSIEYIDPDEFEGMDLYSEEIDFYENVVDYVSPEELQDLGRKVLDAYNNDKNDRQDWDDQVAQGLEMLGVGLEEEDDPFEGACSATHPLILESAVKFQAKASSVLLPAKGPVKVQILGEVTPEKETTARRVKDFMNYQIMDEMEEYFPNMERLLFYLPLIGVGIKKLHYDTFLERPVSEYVPISNFYVNTDATDLKSAQRYTHVLYKTKEDLKRDYVTGIYKEPDMDLTMSLKEDGTIDKTIKESTGEGSANNTDFDGTVTLLEQHVSVYIEEDPLADEQGLCSPYIITIDEDTEEVLSIRRNWRKDDIKREKRMWFVQYPFVPGMGFYGLGFIHLIGNFQASLTAIVRSLVDAGMFANMQGGFKSSNMRVDKEDEAIRPGEFRDVEFVGQDLNNAIVPLNYKEPSSVLFQLLQWLDGRGQRFADSTEQVIQDSTNYGPVGTTMALLDASTKFFSGIHKRLHNAQKQELKILEEINKEFISDDGYPYQVVGYSDTLMKEDFDDTLDVIPESDPNVSSNSQRMTIAQTKMQLAEQANSMAPGTINPQPIFRDIFLAMGEEKDVDKYFPQAQQAQPQDPVTDIMQATKGAPIKAFPGQDHDAHIRVKQTWINDPMGGQHPSLQKFVPLIEANIQEHLMVRYQELMQGDGQKASEEMMAQRAAQVAKYNVDEAVANNMANPMQMVAEAEMMSAQTEKEKADWDRITEAAELVIKAEELEAKKASIVQKDRDSVRRTGADLLEKATDNVMKVAEQETKETLASNTTPQGGNE